MPRADQEQVAKVALGALAQAMLLDRVEYMDVLRDHAAAAAWMPAGATFVSQYQDPERVYLQHEQEAVAPPQISLPVQGTATADAVTATRVLKDLVNSFAPITTITLRLEWSAPKARLLLEVSPVTLPVERYKVLALRVGQSTEPKNALNRDQDFTIEVSSGSRTASFPAGSVHRLIYPDVVFGAGKIVMQTLRLPIASLVERDVDPSDIRSVAFLFDRRSSGTLYVGDVQVSN
jgi:hypothetical protein